MRANFTSEHPDVAAIKLLISGQVCKHRTLIPNHEAHEIHEKFRVVRGFHFLSWCRRAFSLISMME